MATTQTAKTRSTATKSAAKPAAKPVSRSRSKGAAKERVIVVGDGIPTEQIAGEFSPLRLPVSGTPLARTENLELLAELAQNAGIPIKVEGDHVITEEQRQGERRQADRERRNRQDEDESNAAQVAQLLKQEEPEYEPATPDAFQQAVAKLAQEFNMPVPNVSFGVAFTPRSGRPNQNGISRPGVDTVTGKIWRCADQLTAQKKSPVSVAELFQHPDLRLLNDHTIRTQYARWRQFNGIKGSVESEPAKVKAAPAAKQAVTMEWPEMPDEEYARYLEQEKQGVLAEGFKPWMQAEAERRAAIREATKLPQGPMSDVVYDKLLKLEEGEELPKEWEAMLLAEKIRRGDR